MNKNFGADLSTGHLTRGVKIHHMKEILEWKEGDFAYVSSFLPGFFNL